MTEISLKKFKWIKRNIPIIYFSSFTNTEHSELCYEYRVETGYCIVGKSEEFVRLVDTKDDSGNIVTKAYLICEESE